MEKVYLLNEELIEYEAGLRSVKPENPIEGECVFVRPKWAAENVVLKEESQSHVEYTGNEAKEGSYENFYFHGVLVFK